MVACGYHVKLRNKERRTMKEQATKTVKNQTVLRIMVTKLHAFKNHAFNVVDDQAMMDLVNSIKEYGVTNPIVVRPLGNEEYEIVSGHRRTRACEIAELETIPAIVLDLDDDEAAIMMVDSNLIQRDHIAPSERARAYKAKMDALTHQGKRRHADASCQVGEKLSVTKIAEQFGDSDRQVHRFLRLNQLIPELQVFVDDGRMGLTIAVELSYMSIDEQQELLAAIEQANKIPTLTQAQRIREISGSNDVTKEKIVSIMNGTKKVADKALSHNKETITFDYSELKQYFADDCSPEEIKDRILRLLKGDKKSQTQEE